MTSSGAKTANDLSLQPRQEFKPPSTQKNDTPLIMNIE